MEWLRLVSATIRSGKTANALYRLAATGGVRTRTAEDGKVEFAVEDLDALRAGVTKGSKGVRGPRAAGPASAR